MNKEFVPYDIALELREIGFNEECFKYWNHSYSRNNPHKDLSLFQNEHINTVKAPLFQQVFRWFREKHGLDHEIPYAGKPKEYHAFVKDYVYGNNGNSPSVFTYEEAEIECLKRLIQIVKEKQ